MESLPAWGVWIEIALAKYSMLLPPSRSPHGECGLKFASRAGITTRARVAPRMGSVD